MSLEYFADPETYFESRYDASIEWIEENNHAIISNGPFYLERYSPESRTISIKAFADDSYPFDSGFWREFEKVEFPKIIDVEMPNVISRGTELLIPVATEASSKIHYFFTNSDGESVSSGTKAIDDNYVVLELNEQETELLSSGANDLKIFVISDSVLRPDIFSTSFLVVDELAIDLPSTEISNVVSSDTVDLNYGIFVLVIAAVVIVIIFSIRKRTKKQTQLVN